MVIGVNGHHGHLAHVLVAVLYKNHNDFVIIHGNYIDFILIKSNILFKILRPENGGQYCSGQSTRIRSCENNPVRNN